MMSTWKPCSSATRLAAALALVGAAGCGEDAPKIELDAGSDAHVQTDAGLDADVTPPDAGTPDLDVQLTRLTTTGALDTSFGEGGIAVLDLGSTNDVVAGLDVHPDTANLDKIVVFANRTTPGASDSARIIGRVLVDGSGFDTNFAVAAGAPTATSPVPGTHQFNLPGLNDGAKAGHVLADGSIIAPGYTSQPSHVGEMTANRIILVRLDANGAPITTFGSKGVVNANPYEAMDDGEDGFTEAYAVAPIHHGGSDYSFATTGYGRITATSKSVSQINVLFTSTGALDSTTWALSPAPGTVDGTVVVHPNRSVDHDGDPTNADASYEARGRNIVALPGGAVLAVGSSNESVSLANASASDKDVMFSVISADGDPAAIACTGTGLETLNNGQILEFQGEDDYADEACFGAGVSPDNNFVALGCYRATTGADTDAALVILGITHASNVTTGVSVAYAAPIALSATENDRFDVIAFSPDSTRIYAGGYTTVDGVKQGVVACFTTAGARCSDFGTDGVVTVANTTEVKGLTVDSTGRVIAGGSVSVLR